MIIIVKYAFMCELKKKFFCTIFFRGVSTYQSYLYIFIYLPPILALPDVHHEEVAGRIWCIVCARARVCVTAEIKTIRFVTPVAFFDSKRSLLCVCVCVCVCVWSQKMLREWRTVGSLPLLSYTHTHTHTHTHDPPKPTTNHLVTPSQAY